MSVLAYDVLTPKMKARIVRRVQELFDELGAERATAHIMDVLRAQRWDTREDVICSYALFVAQGGELL